MKKRKNLQYTYKSAIRPPKDQKPPQRDLDDYIFRDELVKEHSEK